MCGPEKAYAEWKVRPSSLVSFSIDSDTFTIFHFEYVSHHFFGFEREKRAEAPRAARRGAPAAREHSTRSPSETTGHTTPKKSRLSLASSPFSYNTTALPLGTT